MSSRIVALVVIVLMIASASALALKPYEGPRVYEGDGDRQACNMQGDPGFCLPLDDTWDVVPFSSAGGCNGPANPSDPCLRNDDDYSYPITLNFTFDLYGSMETTVWINNNGNLSFDGGYCTYTPTGFPVSGYPMVAPFWGDVDTRGPSGGIAWMEHGPNYLAVTWDHVGYFNTHDNLLNSFQVIISDGTYEPMGLGNNVCFCYGDMQWTTGDASGGSGGFGGAPATVGVNKGDGVEYALIGRFDHPGMDYDGPGGDPDGVDWLDGQTFCFYVGEEFNLPPVPINFPPGNYTSVNAGDVLNLTVGFIGPEDYQTVHTDVDDGGLANFSWISTDGNPSQVDMVFSPTAAQAGVHVIHFTATDDYDPPGVTDVDLTIEVIYEGPDTAFDIKPTSCPNPLNIKSKGVLPTAILGTDVFDVTMVDVATLLLEGVPPTRTHVEDVATPVAGGGEPCECTEEGPDGFDDLTIKFSNQSIVEALGEVTDGEMRPLTITGQLYDGSPFELVDCVWILDKTKDAPVTAFPNPPGADTPDVKTVERLSWSMIKGLYR
jgi:hypothetical protein